MEKFLSESEKKTLRWISKYINSFGKKVGTISLYVDDPYYVPELKEYISSVNHFEPHYDVPKQLLPIIEHAFEIGQEKLNDVAKFSDEEVNYATIDVSINTETKEFDVSYFFSYYTAGDTDHEEWSDSKESDDQIDLLIRASEEAKTDDTFLTLKYNGSGDSGYIESFFEEGLGVPEDIEDWCYSKLSRYGGWEINEGSQGYFEFDLENRTIELYHTMNYEESKRITLFEEKFD